MSRSARARILTALISLAAAAGAGPVFADGKRDLDDGIAFYENLDTERALYRLKAASEASDLSGKDRAKAFLYLGMVHFENGDRPAAEGAWTKGFALDRNISVPDGTSPKTIEAIEATRAAGAPAPAPAKPPPDDEPGGAKTGTPAGAAASSGNGAAGGAAPKEVGTTGAGIAASSGAGAQPAPLPKAPAPGAGKDALTASAAPPPEDSTTTWLIIGGVAAAVAGAAVVAVLLVAGGGDCKEGGGCLTITLE